MRSVEECELLLEAAGGDLLLKYVNELFWLRLMHNDQVINDFQYQQILLKIANRYANKVKSA